MPASHPALDALRAQITEDPPSRMEHVWGSTADYMDELYRGTERLNQQIRDLSSADGEQQIVLTKGAGQVLLRTLYACLEVAWVGLHREGSQGGEKLPEPLREVARYVYEALAELADGFEVEPGPERLCAFAASDVEHLDQGVRLLRRWREIAAPEFVESSGR